MHGYNRDQRKHRVSNYLLFLVTILVFMLSSCDLILPHDTNKGYGKIVLVDVSLNYDFSAVRTLEGPLNDVVDVFSSFSALADKNNTPLYVIPMNQYGELARNETTSILQDDLHKVSDILCPTRGHIITVLEKLANGSTLADVSYKNNVVQESINNFIDFFSSSSSTYLVNSDLGTVTDNDLIVFYYSGHGNDDGSLCLCPTSAESADNYDLYMADINNFLKPNNLLSYVSAIPGKKFIILDSCYSGNAVSEDTYTTNTQNDEYDGSSIWDKLFSSAAVPHNDIYIMTAAISKVKSYEDKYIFPIHGCLTRSMDEAIGWDWKTFTGLADDIPANDGGDITVDSLYAATSAKFDSHYSENYLVVNGGREDLLLFTGL